MVLGVAFEQTIDPPHAALFFAIARSKCSHAQASGPARSESPLRYNRADRLHERNSLRTRLGDHSIPEVS